jgi:serine/threonine protein kinase
MATGDEPSAELRAHLADCSSCRARLERFRAEVGLLRREAPQAVVAASTAIGPTSDGAPANGHAGDPDAAAPWPVAESSATRSSEPGTDLGFSYEPGASGVAPFPAAIGKYLVVGRFPPTGQAEVYRVVHPGLGRDLVLRLARDPVELGGRSEIIEEGRILASLEHPHLVRVYDQDFLDDRPYLVMEFIRGRTLEQLADEGGLTPRRAAALVAKVAGAVGYAHRHGIVHRDIKPKNILVDEAGEPRLIDFGMARLRHAWSDDPGRPGGTFAFMAPEQARIESPAEQAKVGPRSDLFALGAVLYYLLTRQAPFPGETWRESMDSARRCDFDPAALNQSRVPRRLRRICLKAMASDPADRYASAETLQKALKRFLLWPKVLAVLSVICAVALLGRLVGGRMWPQPDSIPSQSPTVVIQHTSPPPGSLAGKLTIRVWSNEGGGKRGLKVDEPGALPLLPGEKVHLEARLNQPAHAYLLWLDGQGHVSLLYPRDDGKFGSRPSGDLARETVNSPEALDEGHGMTGPGGLETVLLLARRMPLPPGTDLPGLIGPLRPAPLRDVREVAVRGFDEGQPTETLRLGQYRGIGDEPDKIDDPLLQLMERLRNEGPFEVIKALRFAYRGE